MGNSIKLNNMFYAITSQLRMRLPLHSCSGNCTTSSLLRWLHDFTQVTLQLRDYSDDSTSQLLRWLYHFTVIQVTLPLQSCLGHYSTSYSLRWLQSFTVTQVNNTSYVFRSLYDFTVTTWYGSSSFTNLVLSEEDLVFLQWFVLTPWFSIFFIPSCTYYWRVSFALVWYFTCFLW